MNKKDSFSQLILKKFFIWFYVFIINKDEEVWKSECFRWNTWTGKKKQSVSRSKLRIGIRFLEEAIDNGSEDAAVYYGRMLINGEVIPQDLDKAEEILSMFSMKKNSEVALLVGLIMKKKGKHKNAFELFGIASSLGNGEAQYERGKLLFKGVGCKINKPEAMKMFQMSKKNGIDKSGKFLSKHERSNLGNKHDPKNDMDAESLNREGFKHYNGDGIPVDRKEVARYYKMAIDNGDSSAMYNYAVMLKNGDGIPVDKKEAARYFKMAIDKGDSDAMYSYAVMLDNGDGIPVDKKEAARYYKMASEK